MAIVTLGELLHRKAGGAISAQSPLQVRQFDGSGNAISPATETTLGAVKTAVESLAQEDFATQTTLAALKAEVDKLTALVSDGRLKTEATLTGQTVTVETIVDAVSVAANDDTGWITLDTKGASLTWLAISIDKAPWSLYGRGGPWQPTNGNTTSRFFPELSNVQATASASAPIMTLPIIAMAVTDNPLYPTTMEEALRVALVGQQQIRLANGSDETATVTIRALRSILR